jgi:hypothetical protein
MRERGRERKGEEARYSSELHQDSEDRKATTASRIPFEVEAQLGQNVPEELQLWFGYTRRLRFTAPNKVVHFWLKLRCRR